MSFRQIREIEYECDFCQSKESTDNQGVIPGWLHLHSSNRSANFCSSVCAVDWLTWNGEAFHLKKREEVRCKCGGRAFAVEDLGDDWWIECEDCYRTTHPSYQSCESEAWKLWEEKQ